MQNHANVVLKDKFFAPRQKINISSTIPSSIKRCRETGRIDAFKLQWTPGSSLPVPHVFWDSDVAKVMEGMAYVAKDSPEIAEELDKLVDLVISAQQPDGYLNTHFTVIEKEKRFQDLTMLHELYCAGHLTEAAVAHFQATGNRKFLDAMCRYCDYICETFGENGIPGYPGHEELELALVKLYNVTGKNEYLHQAELFIARRGTEPNYLEEKEKYSRKNLVFCQAHKPLTEQTEIEGHAVRALYLACGMADVAEKTANRTMLDQCETFFDDLMDNKVYITGGVGSREMQEFIGGSGDQVSERSYAESCAAIASVLFASRMLKITGKAKFAEAVERTLFNCCMSGISLSGDRFFYSNLHACHRGMYHINHVSNTRQPWYNTSCCPTNYCRFLPQLADFCYRSDEKSVTVDIPVSAEIQSGNYALEVISGYPYDGKILIRVKKGGNFTLRVRIPLWCKNFQIPQQGKIEDSYWQITGNFANGETFDFNFDMPVEKIFSTVPSLASMAALCRGPLVYCVEMPCESETTPFEVILSDDSRFTLKKAEDLPENCVSIEFNAMRLTKPEKLYSTTPGKLEKITVSAIPYAFWQNRQLSEMTIFMPFYHK